MRHNLWFGDDNAVTLDTILKHIKYKFCPIAEVSLRYCEFSHTFCTDYCIYTVYNVIAILTLTLSSDVIFRLNCAVFKIFFDLLIKDKI